MKIVMNAIGVSLAAFLVLVGAASMAEARYVGHPVARHSVARGYVGHPVARSVNRNYGNYSGYRRYAYSTSYRRYASNSTARGEYQLLEGQRLRRFARVRDQPVREPWICEPWICEPGITCNSSVRVPSSRARFGAGFNGLSSEGPTFASVPQGALFTSVMVASRVLEVGIPNANELVAEQF